MLNEAAASWFDFREIAAVCRLGLLTLRYLQLAAGGSKGIRNGSLSMFGQQLRCK